MFTYVELFAGIGGFRSALDQLGGICTFASEIDKFATISYRAMYDGSPELHGDITKIDAKDVPEHDLLVGGFPCQAFSVAGQRKGFGDTRGTLFFEIARIARAKRPKLMFLENVKGLLSHDKGRTLDIMVQTLNDIGYAVDFSILNSKFYGVPQSRERVFIVCSRDVEPEAWSIEGNGVLAKAKRRLQAMGARTFNFDWPKNGEVMTRLRDILEPEVDEKYYLSPDKTLKLSEEISSKSDSVRVVGRLAEVNGHDICKRVYSAESVAPTIPTGSSGNTTPKILQRPRGRNSSGRVYDVAPTLTTSAYEHNNYVLEKFTVIQKTHSTTTTVKYDETGTLQAARLDKVPQVVTESTSRYRIRKLTPRECWRLQGFTDDQLDKARSAGVSDSQLYKQAGNAVTVNVTHAIAQRLVPMIKSQEEVTEWVV
ncbi:DNA (cytosine-5-)-methyltransferase [Paenibacillus larvae]|uniref:DNA (cytosine-5-)-methyltransferase n=1 Tax=Paenibacillus larvae TaxID=1464 RepID=UPI00288CCF06|nr:DNA (cytosine-5-)-methyltransferase [Paenibacillus larvae]MDT2265624.1 DNA (cytosine-5-)-methyltransferase [Paenibacillus larvae]